MRRRLLATIMSVTAVSILLFAIPLGIVLGRLIDEQAALRLERHAILAARSVPADFASGEDPTELPLDADIDDALYDAEGRLVTGTGPATVDSLTRQALDNHVVDGEIGEALVVAIPVVDHERVIGAIRAEQSTASIDARRTRTLALIAALGAGIVAVATGIGWLLAGRLVRPIRQLRDATVQLGTGDFAIDTPTSRLPEIAETSSALGATARRLDELISRERAFSADASHQLRTPLTAMRTTLETALAFPRPDPTVAINEALGDIDRLERTIAELLDIARTTDRPAAIDLEPVLAGLDDAWAPVATAQLRHLRIDRGRDTPRVVGHPTMLRHALDVLIDNALAHGQGCITVSVTNDEHSVTIGVTDEGEGFSHTGLASDDVDTGLRPDAHGGRGLPLARRLVTAQRGRLSISPPPGGRIAIRLRRADTVG